MRPLFLAVAALLGAGSAAAQSPAVLLELDNPLEIVRFNRGEGLSVGIGVTMGIRGSMTAGLARARYSLGDERAQGMAGVRHVAERGQVQLALFSEMRDADPLAPGLSVTNSLPSLLLSHDEGSYVFGTGVELRAVGPWRWGTELTVALSYADESAPRATVGSGLIYDFPPNTPVLAGAYYGLSASLLGGEIGGDNTWFAGLEATGGAERYARAWAGVNRRREIGHGLDVALFGWAGGGGGSADVPQRAFRLGGNRTLRGYDAGSFAGAWAWTLGVDVGAAHRVIAPVVFVDAGQAERSDVAVAAGAGISIMRGMARIHVATPLTHDPRARVDVMFAVRR